MVPDTVCQTASRQSRSQYRCNGVIPYSQKSQEIRLKAACALSRAHIKSFVWGEDALAFIHFVPVNLHALHLVVADHDLGLGANKIIESLPYELFTGILGRDYVESILSDPNQPRTFPNSVHLQLTTRAAERSVDDPEMIVFHPQSQFFLDIHDDSRSLSLPPFPENIRFPTRTAFLDSIIATYLDPPSGRVHTRLMSTLRVWMAYLFTYTLRNTPAVLPTGDLEPERGQVLQSLKPENRPYFEAFARGELCKSREHMMLRKEILEKLGKYEEARRPLPVFPPGNPAIMAKIRADRANALANQTRPYSVSALRGAHSTIARFIRLIR
ncbi:hypothetical protein LshimejAT787_1204480 [Lyophyllum shimeji]|uniref:Uncharacterized protein n=1 Tax=Lyophyllum shimeji TaxID=47721 RepID=A0A9P3UPP2_LYOSH|nr:hypothetical protein LshimejAT787_1204480 [Lyophyllum shimeji]